MEELDQYDVIVVGGGTAGLPAALSCLQHGLRVLVLEKANRFGGTLWITGASYSAAGTRLQKAKGIADSPQQHFDDANAIGHGFADQDLLRLACEQAAAGVDWLEDLGVAFADSPRLGPEHELYSVARTHYQPGTPSAVEGTGVPLLRVLRDNLHRYIKDGSCLMLREQRVTELLVEGRRVVGVTFLDKGGRPHTAHAPVVVLATGGYAASRELLRRFNPGQSDVATMTSPTSTGDGLKMAEAIGVRITHTELINPGIGGIEDPAQPGTIMLWMLLNMGRPAAQTGDIWVNLAGKRFVREDDPSHDHQEKVLIQQPSMIMFSIYDERMRTGPNNFSRQWTIEVERRDIDGFNVKRADSLEALAEKMQLPTAAFVDTVRRYNQSIESGLDEEFGREALLTKIQHPPFYALRSRGHILLTRGGIKVNLDLQALDREDQAIDGLYAVGEVLGNGRLSGDASVGGMGVGPCFTFGRLLGERLSSRLGRRTVASSG